MQVQLMQCNNIESGSVEIKEQTLKIKLPPAKPGVYLY